VRRGELHDAVPVRRRRRRAEGIAE
jgi:hypothetical protein